MQKLFVILFLVCAWAGVAKEMAGKVVAIEGKAKTSIKGKKDRKLDRGSVIFTDEMIHVGGASKLQIRFTDGSLVNLIPNTKYQIQNYSYTDNVSTNQFEGRVFIGGFRHLTGNIGQKNPNAVKIKTPAAIIGVRGTIFEVLVNENEPMIVGCESGTISVTNQVGSVTLGPSSPNQFSSIGSVNTKPQVLDARPANFGERLFSAPPGGVPFDAQGKARLIPQTRVKGGC